MQNRLINSPFATSVTPSMIRNLLNNKRKNRQGDAECVKQMLQCDDIKPSVVYPVNEEDMPNEINV